MRQHPTRFHRRLRRGIPPQFRWTVWKAALGYSPEGAPKDYEILASHPNQWSTLISLDIGRTFSELAEFDTQRQEALQRLLNAYANHSPAVGYCQGMNYVAGLMLLVSGNELEAFGMFVCLMDNDGLNGFYMECMPLLRRYVSAGDRLIKEAVPELRSHFIEKNVPLGLYLHQWFLTLFIKSFPLSTVLVVWDVIICTGLPIILPITVAILKVFETGLLRMQFEDINMAFKAMRTYKDSEYMALRIGQILMKHTNLLDEPARIRAYLEEARLEDNGGSGPEDDVPFEQDECRSQRSTPRMPPGFELQQFRKRPPSRRCRMLADGSCGRDMLNSKDTSCLTRELSMAGFPEPEEDDGNDDEDADD